MQALSIAAKSLGRQALQSQTGVKASTPLLRGNSQAGPAVVSAQQLPATQSHTPTAVQASPTSSAAGECGLVPPSPTTSQSSPLPKKKYFGSCSICGSSDFSRKSSLDRHVRACREKAENEKVALRDRSPRRPPRLPALQLTVRQDIAGLLASLDHYSQVLCYPLM